MKGPVAAAILVNLEISPWLQQSELIDLDRAMQQGESLQLYIHGLHRDKIARKT